MLYVLCATTSICGFVGVAGVGVALAILPWDIILDGAIRNPLSFFTLAAGGAVLFALLPISLTAMVVGTLGLRIAWRDEDQNRRAPRHETGMPKPTTLDDILVNPEMEDRRKAKGPANTKPAEPHLNPRNEG